MNRMWIVARQAFLTQVHQRSFLIMIFLFPLFVGGLGVFSGMLSARQAEATEGLGRIGVVDLSGVLAAEREKPEEYVTVDSEAAAEAALAEQAIGAYFVVPADYLSSGEVHGYAHQPIATGIQNQFLDYLVANLLAHRPAEEVALVRDPAQITMATLDGRLDVPEETGIFMIMAPIFFAVIFVMSISITASTMMQMVVEEKESRIVEILATTITPLQLLAGKIIAMFALGLVQLLVWIVATIVVLKVRPDTAQFVSGLRYPAWLLAVAALYLLLGYLLYGTLLAGIGASSSSMQEAQPLSGLFSMLAVAPLFLMATFLENPNGLWPTVLSLFPFSAPTAMMVRMVLGQTPLWQIALSLGLLAATTALVLWLAAWVFRVGLLMTGNRLTPRALLAAIRREKGGALVSVGGSDE